MMSPAEDGVPPAPPPVEPPALGAARVGAEMRAARLRLGWALPDVANHLRIRLPYLEAIEDGRLADLPGNAYAVGFIRGYATFLGLDAAEVARRFRAEAQEINGKPILAFPAPVPERGVPAGAVVLVGVVIAVAAYAGMVQVLGLGAPAPAIVVPAVPERLAPLADRAAPPSNPSPQVASILPASPVPCRTPRYRPGPGPHPAAGACPPPCPAAARPGRDGAHDPAPEGRFLGPGARSAGPRAAQPRDACG